MTVSETSLVGRDSRTVHDPFLKKDVQISDRLLDRLRGRYACGPTMENGEPEFGWREHETPPIQHEAAETIERLTLERDDFKQKYERWHDVAMRAGVVCCVGGGLMYSHKQRMEAAEAQRDGAYEECAKIAEQWLESSWCDEVFAAMSIASAIRSARLKPDQ